jgi:hypothetical protein
MDLVKSGAVSNRHKETFRGKCVTSYGFGTRELMRWLDRNPLVEFQAIDKVFSPIQIGRNPGFMCVLPARKVDLSGGIALHVGKGNVAAGPGEAIDCVNGAELSEGGRVLFALPSRNLKGEPNILVSIEQLPNQFGHEEAVDMVAIEYGVANLRGRTVRERAQALIEVAHPDDRPLLVEKAKELKVLYADQIYLAGSAHLYPAEVETTNVVKGGLEVRFRAIKPSDEEQMRRLFCRFSDESVHYRYFTPIKTMPHSKMQEYVNVDYSKTMSIVGLVGQSGQGKIIAEGRFVRKQHKPYADLAFVVDEEYQLRSRQSQRSYRMSKKKLEGTRNYTTLTITVKHEDLEWLKATCKRMKRSFPKDIVNKSSLVRLGLAQLRKTEDLENLIRMNLMDFL